MRPGVQDTMVIMPPQFYAIFRDWAGRKGVGTTPAYDLPWKLPPGSPAVHILKLIPATHPRVPVGWTNHLALELRHALGVESRAVFGAMLGVTRNAVNKWEIRALRGETCRMSDSTRSGLNGLLASAPPEVQEQFARYELTEVT